MNNAYKLVKKIISTPPNYSEDMTQPYILFLGCILPFPGNILYIAKLVLVAWNKHPSKVLKGLSPAELHLNAHHFFSYPVFTSLLAIEKTSIFLDVFFSAKGTSNATALLQAKSSSYVD